jgi:hypothetical protein
MKTDALIELLARRAGPAPKAVVARRLAPAALAGVVLSAVLAVVFFGTVSGDLYATAIPWVKLGYAGVLALAAGWWTARLSRPVAHVALPSRATLAVVLAMASLGVLGWLATPPEERMVGLMGHSWLSCPWSVAALSLPALAAALWAVRGLAPTRPRAAGFAAGLMAGSLGAFGYAFSCPEPAVSFVAAWYTLGILLTALLGAWLGPRVLRW